MRLLCSSLLLASVAFAQTPASDVSADNGIRIREFYRLASQVQNSVWLKWSQAPDALLLVTQEHEFLTHHATPKDFQPAGKEFVVRPRQFQPNLQATFPAFGSTPVIVVGEPKNTSSKTSTPWLITLLHEHFHQLQYSQPDYYAGTDSLSLSKSGGGAMWMLNYPFPYDKAELAGDFATLKDLLLQAAKERDPDWFKTHAADYVQARKKFFGQLADDDRKYLEFQLWQEGIARYTEIKVAQAAAAYRPSQEYMDLADFTPFAGFGAKRLQDTYEELKAVVLSQRKREVAYSFGAVEGLLLDRLRPSWKASYFTRPFALGPYFDE
ncbi:MAG: hypothetical protein ABI806_01065 [Candidatus Solibacter sp.]